MTILHNHHIIPKHVGGSDESSNLIKLTIEEHADAHKKLYYEHGLIEDYLAWKGLLGLISKEEILKIVLSEAGKKGGRIRSDTLSKEKLSEIASLGGIATWEKHKDLITEVLINNAQRSKRLKEETGRGLGGPPKGKWIWITDGFANKKIKKMMRY